MRAIRIAGGIALVLVIALGGVILAGQRSIPVPERSDYAIDLAALHKLASSRAGDLPVALNALVVARSELPRGAVLAGGGWLATVPMAFPAYQIMYPDGSSLVVDAPYLDRAPAANDPAALAALEDAIARASALLFTHLHGDHVLALLRSSRYDELRRKLVLTRAQQTEPGFAAFPPGSLADVAPLGYEGSAAFAPGVALLAAPGHTPGSQIVYVELASGVQYLLLGDVVWNIDNVRSLTSRPRIVGSTLIGGDEGKVAQQIRALHDLQEKNPDLELVVSHDALHLQEQIRSGRIGEGFAGAR